MEKQSKGGISVLSLLGILFVALKLTGHIDWSWWVVTLPFWGPVVFVLILLLLLMTIEIYQQVQKRKRLGR